MSIKDLALFKLVGSVLKKGKDKIVGATSKDESGKTDESVQATFKAMVGKNEEQSVSENDVVEKIDIKEKEIPKVAIKSEKPVVKKSTKVVKKKVEKEAPAKKTTTKKPIVKKSTTTKAKPVKKESTPKETKEVTKKTTTKEPVKKAVTITKREAKIKLYTEDVQKHNGSVDSSFLAIVVKNLGPSIYRKDAEYVSCTDPKELDTVRNNFLVKKLGFDKSEKEMLNGEIKKVCETMKSSKLKYRATFYYILAKNLKKESALS